MVPDDLNLYPSLRCRLVQSIGSAHPPSSRSTSSQKLRTSSFSSKPSDEHILEASVHSTSLTEIQSKYHPNPQGIMTLASFVSLKKQVETLFWLICYERKILFQLKKQAEKDGSRAILDQSVPDGILPKPNML